MLNRLLNRWLHKHREDCYATQCPLKRLPIPDTVVACLRYECDNVFKRREKSDHRYNYSHGGPCSSSCFEEYCPTHRAEIKRANAAADWARKNVEAAESCRRYTEGATPITCTTKIPHTGCGTQHD